ncbi:MAG TPA: NAD(P)/FAD-dependent oxidoreductase [Candidatus Cybelea sp.]|nr:NAD(P)/FAD-dependent oxidoreductase [Candidatus Cybelea sp.]
MTDQIAAKKPPAYDARLLTQALEEAHLPSLMMAMVHLTGDTSLMTPELRPVYVAFGDGQGGLSEENRARVRASARSAIERYFDSGMRLAAAPSPKTVRRMMDFIAGVDIPEQYAPFLTDELALDGESSKQPRWTSPKLAAAAKGLRVLIIGAGMSGLLAAIRLKQAGIPFEIVEKNADVGGTWLENSYPGCRVDSSNHLYSYSFEPNHHFPNHFSKQDVLLKYFQDAADKYGLRRSIRFNTSVIDARFDEAASRWTVRLKRPDGKEENVTANAVISAVGQLNRPRFPDIPGRESFAGASFHSAEWRHDIDLAGKRVAVIGTGASAYQFVPEIAGQAKDLLVFQRTPPWLLPTPNYHHDVGAGKQWLLEHIPFYAKWYRFWLFWMSSDGLYPAVKADPSWSGPPTAISQRNQEMRNVIVAGLKHQVVDKPDLIDKIVPTYPLGGKRALRDNGLWTATLKRDNVDLITTPIERITPRGIVTKDQVEHAVDVIIYGTGFHASRFLWPMKIYGRKGIELHEQWQGDARAYLGMTVPNFPNFFCLYGPNTNIVVNGSIIFFSECSVRYIIGCLELLAEKDARTIECKRGIHDAFNRRVDDMNKQMAWGMPGVTSWYKNQLGRVSQNWPFPLVDYWKATLAPDPADFELN